MPEDCGMALRVVHSGESTEEPTPWINSFRNLVTDARRFFLIAEEIHSLHKLCHHTRLPFRSAAAAKPPLADGVARVLALPEELFVAHNRSVRMEPLPGST